jgi:hypothetical protein
MTKEIVSRTLSAPHVLSVAFKSYKRASSISENKAMCWKVNNKKQNYFDNISLVIE